MNSKECEKQLNSLIEHFNNGGLEFNATDVEAIEHLMLENTMQHEQINNLREKLQQRDEVIEESIDHLDCFISDVNLSKYDTLKILMHTKKILKKV